MSQRIHLDATPGLFHQVLHCHQGDVGRQFEIAVVTRDGYEIPSGATFKIQATKPSGLGFTVTGTAANNIISFTSTEDMTSEAGEIPTQLEIKSGNDVIYTSNFLLVCETNVHPSSVTDGSPEEIISEITLLVERAESAASTAGADAAAAAQARVDEMMNYLPTEVTNLKSDINNLPIPSIRTNLYYGDYTRYSGKKWLRGADLYMTDNANYDICRVKVVGGRSYIVGADADITPDRGDVRFADSNDAFVSALTSVGYFGTAFTMPSNVVYVYFSLPTGRLPIIAEASAYPYHDDYAYYIEDDATFPRVETEIANNTSVLDYIMEDSFNLADSTKFTLGKYYTNTGGIGNNDSYFYTDYIPVTAGEKLCASTTSRWMCCFDEYKQIVANTSNISPSGWTVPDGVHYIIITVGIANKDTLVVSKDVSIPYIPYNEHISYEAVSAFNTGNIYGRDGISKHFDSLEANTSVTFSEYPKGLGKGTSITGSAFFDTFDSISVGVGESSYIWFVVDATTIKTYRSGALSDTVAHNLTITDYISFSLLIDDDCVAHLKIDTVSGSFSTETSVAYGWEGFPFFKSTNANTDVKISVTNNDFKKSVWWFGDSYSGWAEWRILGALKSLGVTDGMLVDAVPGQRSYYDADSGAYVDFSKAIKFGTPKYLVWAIGMNDSDNNYKLFANSIAKLCELMHIEFIAVKIPSVPSVNNSNINSYIDAQGYRFVDWNKAVGANSSGVWYSGMLSNDNVHPNPSGAEAMALRTVVDFVEITQYR